MVVEDEPDVYELLLAMFEVWGIEGVAFVDGMEAMSWIQDVDRGVVTDELPQLAIVDIRLPDISGVQVGEYLRQSSRLGHVPIVLITAYALDPDEERAAILRAGADMLMYKPLPEVSKLRVMLEEIIATHRDRSVSFRVVAPETTTPAMPAPSTPSASAPADINRRPKVIHRPPHTSSIAPPAASSSASALLSSRQAQPKTDPPGPEPPVTGRADS